MAVLTLANFKTLAGISGTSDDTRLQLLLDQAHAALRRYCGRSLTDGFESATRTEDYESESGEIQLREWPVSSITSITPIANDNTLGTALDSTTYQLDTRTGIVKLNGTESGRVLYDEDIASVALTGWGWHPSFGRVRVVYVSSSPASDVAGIIYDLTSSRYQSINTGANIASQSLGQWSVTFTTGEVRAAIERAGMNTLRTGGL